MYWSHTFQGGHQDSRTDRNSTADTCHPLAELFCSLWGILLRSTCGTIWIENSPFRKDLPAVCVLLIPFFLLLLEAFSYYSLCRFTKASSNMRLLTVLRFCARNGTTRNWTQSVMNGAKSMSSASATLHTTFWSSTVAAQSRSFHRPDCSCWPTLNKSCSCLYIRARTTLGCSGKKTWLQSLFLIRALWAILSIHITSDRLKATAVNYFVHFDNHCVRFMDSPYTNNCRF